MPKTKMVRRMFGMLAEAKAQAGRRKEAGNLPGWFMEMDHQVQFAVRRMDGEGER
jgi:hypothetical protein